MFNLLNAACAAIPTVGAGKSCCARAGFVVAPPAFDRFIVRWKTSSLSGASGPGESGRGLGGLFPRLSASVVDACDRADAAEATLRVGSSGEPGSSFRGCSEDVPLRAESEY